MALEPIPKAHGFAIKPDLKKGKSRRGLHHQRRFLHGFALLLQHQHLPMPIVA